VTDTPWVHFAVEETEQGWIVWLKITTATKRYQGPASLYPFSSADAAWSWVREQFGPDASGGSPAEGDAAGADMKSAQLLDEPPDLP
jgi:hypothetical protein